MSSATEDAKRQQALALEARRRGIPEWQLEAAKAVDDALVRSIVDDFRRGPSQPSSMAHKGPAPEPKRGSGWAEPVSVEVPGVKLVDEICDHFARLDKAEQVKQALELAAISKRADKMK